MRRKPKTDDPEIPVFEEIKPTHPLYMAGAKAFADGVNIDDCPHKIGAGTGRLGWMAGFIAARTTARVGPIFAKFGVDWP